MIHNAYFIISIFLMGATLTVFGLCFLLLAIPEKPLLRNYRVARKVMAFAYFFFALMNSLEYFMYTTDERSGTDNSVLQLVTLIVGTSQALLFTYTLTTLVNVRFPARRTIIREIWIVLGFVILVITFYFAFPGYWSKISFPLLSIGYFLLLLRYTLLFLKQYRRYLRRGADYFSDAEERRLRWVKFAFLSALTIGVLALFFTLFASSSASLLFSILLLVFYSYFGIYFINYSLRFDRLGEIVEEKEAENRKEAIVDKAGVDEAEGMVRVVDTLDTLLDDKINRWVVDRIYTQQGITLAQMCTQIGTNQKYLSRYINARAKNFREWINTLRMEEVKRRMMEEPHRPTEEIAIEAGYANAKYFRKLFRDHTGSNPEEFRRN